MASCGPDNAAASKDPKSTGSNEKAAVKARGTAASPHGVPDGPPAPPPESIDELTPEQVVELMLKRCHGSLRGARKMANGVIKLGGSATDERPELILLGSDGCMRVHRRDGTRETQIGKRAWRIAKVRDEFEITPIEADELGALTRLQRLLRATLLEPLYEQAKVTRQGPTVFAIKTKTGTTWRLEIRQIKLAGGAVQWFPSILTGPPGKITFEELRHFGVTNLPKQVVLDTIGRRWFMLEDCGLVYDAAVFTNPNLDTKPAPALVQVAGFTPDPPVGECALRTIAPKVALITPDPGDWEQRIQTLLKNGAMLESQGQQAADLDFLFDEGGKRYLAQPFMMGDPDQRGHPFVKRKGQRIRHLPGHRAVLVYPKNGTLETCEKAARALLAAFLAKNKLTAAGPLRLIPWIEVEKKVLSPREQQTLRIGFEQPVN